MPKGLTLLVVVALLGLAVAVALAQGVVYLNGVAYGWPSSQGDADDVLTASGTAPIDWSPVATSEGLWSGCLVLSTVTCPAGWTRLAAADARILRGAATEGGTGGVDTHEHGLAGILSASGVPVTGTTATSGFTISKFTAVASPSHTHGTGGGAAGGDSPGGPPAGSAATSFAIGSTGPSHSHDDGSYAGASHTHTDGSLSGGSHGHAVGTFDDATASSVPAYYNLIVCEKD